MRLALIALFVFLLPVSGMSADATSSDPAMAGEQWLRLVDDANYSASWREASSEFKKQIPEDKWIEALGTIRSPLGAVSARKVANVTTTKTLPGMPDGDYTVIQFQTSFAHKASAVETLTLIRGASGAKVGGYFIK